MLNALLNPSMLAEFQKIRGIGVGVQDIGPENPVGDRRSVPRQERRPQGPAADGSGRLRQRGRYDRRAWTCVTFGDGGGAAFDDTVVILATPSPKGKDLLQWAVRQYKGRSTQPSLASANKSFSRISKQARQQNALTLWLNVDEAYARLTKILPAGQIPPATPDASTAWSISRISTMSSLTLSLRETGIALEANVGFKPGYQSLVYSLIHTPSLNKAALKAVPADAVALLSAHAGRRRDAAGPGGQRQDPQRHRRSTSGRRSSATSSRSRSLSCRRGSLCCRKARRSRRSCSPSVWRSPAKTRPRPSSSWGPSCKWRTCWPPTRSSLRRRRAGTRSPWPTA